MTAVPDCWRFLGCMCSIEPYRHSGGRSMTCHYDLADQIRHRHLASDGVLHRANRLPKCPFLPEVQPKAARLPTRQSGKFRSFFLDIFSRIFYNISHIGKCSEGKSTSFPCLTESRPDAERETGRREGTWLRSSAAEHLSRDGFARYSGGCCWASARRFRLRNEEKWYHGQ